MTNNFFSNAKNHLQYRIVAEYLNNTAQVALAGFAAQEQTEATLFRHLYNMCLQSDGSLKSTHTLLCGMMQQWQSAFSIPSAQMLQTVAFNFPQSQLQSVCLYKTKPGEKEKLINRILM